MFSKLQNNGRYSINVFAMKTKFSQNFDNWRIFKKSFLFIYAWLQIFFMNNFIQPNKQVLL